MIRSDHMIMSSPLAKQAAVLSFFVVACGIALQTGVTEAPLTYWLVASLAIMGASTVAAGAIGRRPTAPNLEVAVIAADFLAIAILRWATGGAASIFGSLFILPLVWMATRPGRRYAWFAALGVSVVLLLNVPLDLLLFGRATELVFIVRGLWTPSVCLLAALLVNELSAIARRHLSESQARERSSAAELDRAASVQRALFPKDSQPALGVSAAGSCVPARSVGGDFFDWYPIDGGVALTMGDVMGKGVGAGMVAASARAVIRGAVDVDDPVVAVNQLASFVTTELGDELTYLTLFHGRLDLTTGVLDYVDAGHGLSLLVRPDGSHLRLGSGDLPVGIVAGTTYTSHRVIVEPGDSLVSFSDGVLDLWDGRMSAVDEIARLASQARSAEALTDTVAALARRQPNPDDVTIVVIRREPALIGTRHTRPA